MRLLAPSFVPIRSAIQASCTPGFDCLIRFAAYTLTKLASFYLIDSGTKMPTVLFFRPRYLIQLLFFLCFAGQCDATEVGLISANAKYRISPQPNYKLTQDGDNLRKLTDGLYAPTHYWTASEYTVGWQTSGTIDISLEFPQVEPVGLVCFRTARGQAAGVAYPLSALAFISRDGRNYHFIADIMSGISDKIGNYQVRRFCTDAGGVPAKHLILRIVPNGSFFFTDEIEVYRSDRQNAISDYGIRGSQIATFVEEAQQSSFEHQALLDMVQVFAGDAQAIAGSSRGTNRAVPALRDVTLSTGGESADEALEKVFFINAQFEASRVASDIAVWAVDPWKTFSQIEIVPQSTSNSSRCDLFVGGQCSLAIALLPLSESAQDVVVQVKGGGLAGNVRLGRVLPILSGPQPRYVFDPIEPLTGDRLSMKVGQTAMLWVTIDGSASPPASDSVTITFNSTEKPEALASFRIDARIWPIKSSELTYPWSDNWDYMNWPLLRNKRAAALEDLKAHHVNVRTLHPEELPWPKVRMGGTYPPLNFSKFDRSIGKPGEGIRYLLFLGLNSEGYRKLKSTFHANDPSIGKAFVHWVSDIAQHMEQRGFSFDEFAFYPIDEPQSSEDFTLLSKYADLIRSAEPRAKIFVTIDKPATPMVSTVVRICDIVQFGDAPGIDAAVELSKSAGTEAWLYGSSPKQSDILATNRTRLIRATLLGADGGGFWAYADANNDGSAWNDFDSRRIDFSVVYDRGVNLLTSRRWEAWKEGAEDAALMKKWMELGHTLADADRESFLRWGMDFKLDQSSLTELRFRMLSEIDAPN